MVNDEDILNQQILDLIKENYSKRQRQAYIDYTNRTPELLPWDNLYCGHLINRTENKKRMVSYRPNNGLIWENWGCYQVYPSCNHTNSSEESVKFFLITHTQDWGNWKGLWKVGRKSGRPEDMAGLQEWLCTRIQALSADDHGYSAAANHSQETDSQITTADAIQSLANTPIKDK